MILWMHNLQTDFYCILKIKSPQLYFWLAEFGNYFNCDCKIEEISKKMTNKMTGFHLGSILQIHLFLKVLLSWFKTAFECQYVK